MDALRRIRPRQVRPGNPTRRVRAAQPQDTVLRLRGKNRSLSAALDQLQLGVPLNWGQVEDDPELATLARLQQAGQECRLAPVRELPAEAKAELVERLAPLLPHPQEKQEKSAPKSLAGFSENVQVLTQVDEDVAISVNWAGIFAKGALVVAAVVMLLWGLSTILKVSATPTFTWIEARKGNEAVTRLRRPISADTLPCRVVRAENPNRPGYFVPVQSLRDAQAGVDFNIPLLPDQITEPKAYAFQLALAAVDPCEGNTIRPSDPAALISLQYSTSTQGAGGSATSGVSSRAAGIKTVSTGMTLFAANEQLTVLDVTRGDWKEVTIGDLHGLYWHGGPYRDQAGVQWMGDVSVMVIEHEDTVVTMVGSVSEGITEDMLLAAAKSIVW